MWSYSRLGLVNAQSIMHITFQLYDVLRFESTVTVVIYVLHQYIISNEPNTPNVIYENLKLKWNQQIYTVSDDRKHLKQHTPSFRLITGIETETTIEEDFSIKCTAQSRPHLVVHLASANRTAHWNHTRLFMRMRVTHS